MDLLNTKMKRIRCSNNFSPHLHAYMFCSLQVSEVRFDFNERMGRIQFVTKLSSALGCATNLLTMRRSLIRIYFFMYCKEEICGYKNI
jgi:hypothetical protein